MAKQVLLIYQDCLHCPERREWLESQQTAAKKHKLKIVETPYNFPGAKELILAAKAEGVDRLPLFTDGEKFSNSIADFIETKQKKKSVAKVKEDKDGADQEA